MYYFASKRILFEFLKKILEFRIKLDENKNMGFCEVNLCFSPSFLKVSEFSRQIIETP